MKPIVVLNHHTQRARLPSIASQAVFSLSLLVSTSVSATPIIVNGSFEKPDLSSLPDNYYGVVPTGWSASSGGIVKGVGGGLFPF